MSKKPTLAIMDLDGLIFYAGWGLRDQLTMIGRIQFKKKIDSLIKSILVRTKADYFVGFFGYSGGTFRHRFATIKPYKGARKSEPWQDFFKPIAREYFEEGWGFYGVRDIEADDAVVIAYHQYKADYNIVMVEEDKDGLQKGAFTRFNPRTSRLEEINHLEGRAHFWGQFLVGEQSPIFI